MVETLRASRAEDPALAEYAVAQIFTASRAEAIAADLTDGRRPELIRAYREAVLALRDELGEERLLAELRARIAPVCGRVLPGLSSGPPPGTSYVIIGPEAQIDSYEAYLASTNAPAKVARAFPRDFWLVD